MFVYARSSLFARRTQFAQTPHLPHLIGAPPFFPFSRAAAACASVVPVVAQRRRASWAAGEFFFI
jgi:hypothetical protein